MLTLLLVKFTAINKIHEIDPDVCGSWNQCFDYMTLMNRLTKLYSKKKELRDDFMKYLKKVSLEETNEKIDDSRGDSIG